MENFLSSLIFHTFVVTMPFTLEIDIVSIILKGILIGVLASAPMGPVGILCVQRTLNKGRWFGFVTGVGAAISDILYAMVTGFGMSFALDFIQDPRVTYILQISGSVILLFFGIHCFRSDPTKNMHVSGKKKGTLAYNGITAFWVTFLNPLIVFLFMAIFAQLNFVIPDRPLEMSIGYLSIFGGALMWWFGLTWLIDLIREKFDTNGIFIINKTIGAVVIIISLVIMFGTVFNLYHIHY